MYCIFNPQKLVEVKVLIKGEMQSDLNIVFVKKNKLLSALY